MCCVYMNNGESDRCDSVIMIICVIISRISGDRFSCLFSGGIMWWIGCNSGLISVLSIVFMGDVGFIYDRMVEVMVIYISMLNVYLSIVKSVVIKFIGMSVIGLMFIDVSSRNRYISVVV